MKKAVIQFGMVMMTAYLTAGGNIVPSRHIPMMATPTLPCYTEKVYYDEKRGLMWQDAPYTDAEDGAYSRERSLGKAGTFQHAMLYCRQLNYAGYLDWRLPTADELMAVHKDPGQHFTYFRDKDFWTSTPTTGRKYYVVYPADAYKYKRRKRQSNYIRCVRCVGQTYDETEE